MRLDEPLVLAPGTRLIPAAELRLDDRLRAGCHEDEVVLTRGGTRARSKVLTPEGRRLARMFESERRIVDVVRDVAQQDQVAADDALRRLFPLLKLLINEGFLIEAGAAAVAAEPALPPGTPVGPFHLKRCVQIYEDTALYEAVGADDGIVALKVARSQAAATLDMLRREAELMAAVPSPPGPSLVARNMTGANPWLATAWIAGRPLLHATRKRSQRDVVMIAEALIRAFAVLHVAGIVHGDVHPGNVLVEPDGAVRILDFGYARRLDPESPQATWKRGGVGFYFEPEYAVARLDDLAMPQASPAGEQYAVAALVYLLLTGKPYLDFPYDEPRMFAAIRDLPPRPFAAAGTTPWPSVESVLARALAKDPAARFSDMAAFAEAFAAAASGPACPRPTANAILSDALDRLMTELLPGGGLFERGLADSPRASVHSGASGIAAGLLGIACARDDAAVLAASRFWSDRALADSASPGAYFSPADDITPQTTGQASIAHGPIGSALVHGLIAGATGDPEGAREAVCMFLAEARHPADEGDLFLGTAGHLHGATLLLESCAGIEGGPRLDELGVFADLVAGRFLRLIEDEPPIGRGGRLQRLGMAHGWAGLLFSVLGWARQRRTILPAAVAQRLSELRSCALRTKHGLRWPILADGDASRADQHMHGWCNGGAGHVLLWTLAAETFGDAHLEVAEEAAAEMLAGMRSGGLPFLCCGQVGAGFAMLTLFRMTHQERHFAAAADLAAQAAETIGDPALPPHSLLRGALGHAALVAALARPEQAVMPVFGLRTGR